MLNKLLISQLYLIHSPLILFPHLITFVKKPELDCIEFETIKKLFSNIKQQLTSIFKTRVRKGIFSDCMNKGEFKILRTSGKRN